MVFRDKLWLIGGIEESGRRVRDIWSSADVVNWQVEESQLDFLDAFTAFDEVEIENGFMWLMGTRFISNWGVSEQVYETWRSSNGVDWEQVPGLEQVAGYFKPVRGFAKFQGYCWNSSRLDGRLYRSKDGLSWQRFYRHTISMP